MSVSIKVENLSKLYRLGEIGTGTLSRDLERWFKMNILGQEDPFMKVGQTNDRTVKGSSDIVYSLRDINFEIQQGETVGIIGRNGAGKSTLLKILSRVTAPSAGRIHVKGRVASLLEVGTGFHPELTGKENIYLNGAILGMRRSEISRKMDEIIDFSGVERYIDTPVKRYSSGMYVRLAFAVAAHLESEILIVDEVLAVGDAEFQKKCLGKMGSVSKSEGRTILFVSHNLQAIKNLCPKSILLENGLISQFDQTNKVIENYLISNRIQAKVSYINEISPHPVFLRSAVVRNKTGSYCQNFNADEEIILEFIFQKNSPIGSTFIHLMINNSEGITVVETDSIEQEDSIISSNKTGQIISVVSIPKRLLNSGSYTLSVGIASSESEKFQIESLSNFLYFEVTADRTIRDIYRQSITSTILEWNTKIIE